MIVQHWYRLEFCSVRATFVRHLRGSNQSARVTPLVGTCLFCVIQAKHVHVPVFREFGACLFFLNVSEEFGLLHVCPSRTWH